MMTLRCNRRTGFHWIVMLGSAWAILSNPAKSQVLYGTLVGNVADPSGAAVSGAKVVARATATGQERSTETDGNGIYAIRDLQAGPYSVTVTAQGFTSVERRSIELRVNSETRVDVQLAIA